ncbi:hypothetical protein ACRAWG_22705 [Methylobacterium sp. P31]
MIADRDAGRRASLRKVVERFDSRSMIDEAVSGQALCDILLRHRPTLAFVGLQLEDLSGPEAVAVARRAGAEPPCLVLVAHRVLAQWQEIATSLGAYEVLKTPSTRAISSNSCMPMRAAVRRPGRCSPAHPRPVARRSAAWWPAAVSPSNSTRRMTAVMR